MQVVEHIYEGMHESTHLSQLKLLLKYPWLVRTVGLTITEFMAKFFTNKRLINVITQYWCYLGLPPKQGNAILFIGCLMSYLIKGAYFPQSRSHNLSLLITETIKNNGGIIHYNALVNKILMEKEKIIGIELLNGKRFYAPAVISNVNPICTIEKMLPPNTIPDIFLKSIYAQSISPSIFSVYLGLNKTSQELGIHDYELFIYSTDDVDEAAIETGIEQSKLMVATCYNLIHPNISPPGTSILVLGTLMLGKEWHSVAPTDYIRIKQKVANDLINLYEKLIHVQIRDNIEVMEIGSPVTYYRYSKNLDGAIYGTDNSVYNSPLFKLKNKTPLKNFYFCGAWTNEGGGYSSALGSGRKAAQAYLRDREKLQQK
jgi:prolycopene isomerase